MTNVRAGSDGVGERASVDADRSDGRHEAEIDHRPASRTGDGGGERITTLSRPLSATIAAVVAELAHTRDPWWIIASAAAALHGAHPITVADVDILLSSADARRLFPRLGIIPATTSTHPRFRSDLFGRWTAMPLVVEFMAGFRLRNHDRSWWAVQPKTRVPVRVDRSVVFVPALPELRDMFERFGRPKDLARLDLLDRLA